MSSVQWMSSDQWIYIVQWTDSVQWIYIVQWMDIVQWMGSVQWKKAPLLLVVVGSSLMAYE